MNQELFSSIYVDKELSRDARSTMIMVTRRSGRKTDDVLGWRADR